MSIMKIKQRLAAHHYFERLMVRTIGMLAIFLLLTTFVPSLLTGAQAAPPAAPAIPDYTVPINTLWTIIAAFLVFFMQAGFLALEAGCCRPRETMNLLLEDFIDVALTGFVFWLVGFGIMFGAGNQFFGTTGFGLAGFSWTETYKTLDATGAVFDFGIPLGAFWLFQFAFAGTAATIASGAMIGRTGFWANLGYTALVGAVIYPLVGHWLWHPQGFLFVGGALDFAGSTVVHTAGAMVAISGVIVLGPRLGRKFAKDGGGPMPYHNYSLIVIGTLILWFGWFGFNPGSTLSGMNVNAISLVAFNTNLAACTGAITAMFIVYLQTKKWDVGFTCNGALAGLVAITAPCAFVSPLSSAIIGIVAGVLVVVATRAEEMLGLDDVVAAFPVHGANGIWGTLAIGLFAEKTYQFTLTDAGKVNGLLFGGGLDQLLKQLAASGAAITLGLGVWLLFFNLLKVAGILRISAETEIKGVDLELHGVGAYVGQIMDAEDGTPKTAPSGAAVSGRVAATGD
jgi:Amt family ammonium transporter